MLGIFKKVFHKDQRSYERFDKKARAFFYFHYDLITKMDVEGGPRERDENVAISRYPALSKNISAEGLCFSSERKLPAGKRLHLDMYLREGEEPIRMEGEVRWSQAAGSFPSKGAFDTGIRLLSINGRSVPETIHYDQTYRIIWSDVLEVIFGDIRRLRRRVAEGRGAITPA